MDVLSLFAGIGGFDLGLERAGFTIAGQVEIDPWCRAVLARHWPGVPRHDDVRTAAGWWRGLGHATADVVCGGFPCQPVSLAGQGRAQADSRWLWPAFARVIRDLRPGYVLVENVPGLLGRGMGDVLGDLAGLGYDAEWDCIPAAYVGAPHIRNRVWIVAYPGRVGPAEVNRWGAGRPGGPAGRGENRQCVAPPGLVADPIGARLAVGQGEPGDDDTQRPPAQRGSSGADVADADRGRLKEQPQRDSQPDPRIFTSFRHDTQRCRPSPERDHWAAEPGVGRVAHGVPARVDRLRGLGNALVPQIAQLIGELIISREAAGG